jgi:Ca2+-transporting ATPase
MKFHEMKIDQVEKALETDFSSGLSQEEVKKTGESARTK